MALDVIASPHGIIEIDGMLVPRLGYGTMRLTGPGVLGPPADISEARWVVERALQLGVRVFDTAWYYGPDIANELLAERGQFLAAEAKRAQQATEKAQRETEKAYATAMAARRAAEEANQAKSDFFGKLSGLVPLVGINSGRCFAGNAALLGCCDVVIATANSSIGMGGPAMIEGGGLGVFHPDEVGPMSVQMRNGVVDIAVEDEAEAVLAAKRYLSYFQAPLPEWECADQRLLRGVIPENRLRIYDVRAVIEMLADAGAVLELRRHFGPGMVTALIRIEGQPLGLIANNPVHLAGAIDSNGADKAARFMQLCDAFDLPLLFLCDTPGIMVGPEAEKTALVRHCTRMFVTGASLSVPFFTIILRKAYGLGAQAMAGGSFKAPLFTVSWPTGEFGGMGLEGAVKLGYRNELAAIDDALERTNLFEEMVARMYEHGKAVNTASHFEIDDVIDPAESRRWITAALRTAERRDPKSGKARPNIDTW